MDKPLPVPHHKQKAVQKLTSRHITAVYDIGTIDTIRHWLDRNVPVIVFVQASELPHWFGHRFQHAILVVGLDELSVYLLDPATAEDVIVVSRLDFLLAWDEMDNTLAIITRR
ncbi:MAG TPA: hypothetical protein PLD25_19035 [Chloroflexota bacterium]|nr:hypothetical protein [Chloroflexota bacterium]HUM70230.1 hypothetical protein [Chloroflexota bacterium]